MKKGFKDDNPAMAFISVPQNQQELPPAGERDVPSNNFVPLGNSSDGIGRGSKSEGTGSRSEFLRPASGWPPPGGEKMGGASRSPTRGAAASSCTQELPPAGDSSGKIEQGSKSERTGSRSEFLRPASGWPPPGGEKMGGTDVPPLGNSSGDLSLGSKSEGTSSRSDTLAPSLRLAGTDVPPGGEKNKYRMDPRYIETKSKRFGILLQPSVLESLKALAGEKGISVNEAVNEAIKRYIQREEGEISFKGDQW